MSLRFLRKQALVLACCLLGALLLVPVAYGQGRGRGHGGGGGIGIGNPGRGHGGGGGIIDEIGSPGQGHGRGVARGRWESPGTPRGPIVGVPRVRRDRIFRSTHDNRNPFPGTPRRRRVRRGWLKHPGRH